MCSSRTLRRFSLVKRKGPKRKRVGSRTPLTDCKHARRKKAEAKAKHLKHKKLVQDVQDNNTITESDNPTDSTSENEPLAAHPSSPNDGDSGDDSEDAPSDEDDSENDPLSWLLWT